MPFAFPPVWTCPGRPLLTREKSSSKTTNATLLLSGSPAWGQTGAPILAGCIRSAWRHPKAELKSAFLSTDAEEQKEI